MKARETTTVFHLKHIFTHLDPNKGLFDPSLWSLCTNGKALVFLSSLPSADYNALNGPIPSSLPAILTTACVTWITWIIKLFWLNVVVNIVQRLYPFCVVFSLKREPVSGVCVCVACIRCVCPQVCMQVAQRPMEDVARPTLAFPPLFPLDKCLSLSRSLSFSLSLSLSP